MYLVRRVTFIKFFLLVLFAAPYAMALPSFSPQEDEKESLPSVLKADQIDGDRETNTLIASGNVEVARGNSVIYADSITYNKDNKTIRAIGNIKFKNIEVGKLQATEVEVKDDFSSGKFFNAELVFIDGSYLLSPEIERKTPTFSIFRRPVYSLCPNEDIARDPDIAGDKRDFASIKSSQTTIDREKQVMKAKHGVFRIYNVPVVYVPYIKIPMADKKRESGFLTPSYTKTTNFGIGAKIPYYLNIAPNMDLTITPQLHLNSDQIIVRNDFRHIAKYGEYKTGFEVANNKITTNIDTTVVNRTNSKYRWNLASAGIFDFTNNTGVDFDINTISDRNYLRDYHFNYVAYTISQGRLDYIKGREYHALRSIRFQELESITEEKSAPFVMPQLDSHIETKPLFYKEKFALTSNVSVITRDNGLQYRRASFVPEVKVPFNLQGNLFEFSAKAQTDLYSLDNNFEDPANQTAYNEIQTNYKPEVSFNWKLPLIQKNKSNTIMVEPMINFVSSYYRRTFSKVPDEDSNSSELTISNLFINDRIAGYDRNEAGERISYGVKTSLFNKYGEFGLTIGQGYRKSDKTQDVTIRGFADNNKSNFVGQMIYKAPKYLSFTYAFQLNESSYSNDINQLTASLVFDRISFATDYLLLRQNVQNPQEREQISASSTMHLGSKWKVTVAASKDLVIGRVLSRGVTLYRDGCCTVFGFSIIETNPSNLTKPQKTFNLSLSFKNL